MTGRSGTHRYFRTAMTLLIAAWFIASPRANAQARHTLGQPELSVVLSNFQQARIHQQIIQHIRIESAFPFDTLRVEPGIIEGAEIVELHRPTTRRFKSWGVEGYVHETSRAIFPLHEGRLQIPAVRARGAVTDDQGVRHAFEHADGARQIVVNGPALEMINEPWLIANSVTLSEDWSVDPHQLKAGEVARRTITAQVSGSLAEMISPLTMHTGTGIQVLPGTVSRRNEVSERGVTGILVQQFDVRIASEQLSDIPPLQLAWWNDQKQTIARNSVRGWRIEPVLPEQDSLVRDLLHQAEQGRDRGRALMLLLVLPLLVVILIIRLLARHRAHWSIRIARAREWLASRMFGPATVLPSIGFSRIQQAPDADQSSPVHFGADG